MTRDEMLEIMPHRGMNILIDDYLETGESAEGRLTIDEGDAEGRDIFLARGRGGLRYLPYFLVEHVGLAALMAIRAEMGGGRLAYFSKVSRFVGHAEAPAGATIRSLLTKGRDRGDFRSFSAEVLADGVHVFDVGIMAFLAPLDGDLPGRFVEDAPTGYPAGDPGVFPSLHPAMAFVSGETEASGVYPSDHPHVPGHFPAAPLMMGMAQWMAIVEALALLAPVGESEVSGSGRLVISDGRVATDAKGMRLAVSRADDGRIADFRLLSTRSVSFRESISPGDRYAAVVTRDTGGD